MEQDRGEDSLNYAQSQGGVPSEPVAQDIQYDQGQTIQWNASEFIDHQKSPSWFLALTAGAVVFSIIVFFVTGAVIASLAVLLAGLSFGMFAQQKPRTLSYSLLQNAIKIGPKRYSYDDFRTFSLIQDGAIYSIMLEPTRRFMPPLTIYFAPEDGEQIFDILASHIPHQERTSDPIERLMKRIRF